ncbi:LysM peptidoglycan-binding domain-containing protein [candidate division WOR-3 bacterium]|nr:LysM peptidoglycan-binding domain-containing protein [candidate division WOR-3 bacterium]
MKKWHFFLLLGLIPLCSFADNFGIHTQPRYHIVSPGDCLWNISHHYLGNPYRWPEIWEVNKPQIRDPHWIYPGQKFLIPAIEDIFTSSELFETPPPIEVVLIDVPQPVVAYEMSFRCGYISKQPHQFTMHIVDYYDREVPQLSKGFQVYIDGGQNDGIYEGQFLLVEREMNSVSDPATGRDFGKLIYPIGILRVLESDDDISRCLIQDIYEIELEIGDGVSVFEAPVLPTESQMQLTDVDLTGQIAEVFNYVGIVKDVSFVYLNIGSDRGVNIGDVFEILIPSEEISNPTTGAKVIIPERPSGYLQILNVQNETSSGYIFGINSLAEIQKGDKVKLVVRAGI